ncbi:hypothetical protein DFH08DRAFT_938173 [Mycena albidolilacea]|uniref:Transmembrane protein n=1 Tax=Mycena albidolilacea TaxID=1033008 RepID=A0AAD6ZX16_9AGAR|nr:hypothetical protein DFH08DRAFT_938173 [Mycena albidolilacea]
MKSIFRQLRSFRLGYTEECPYPWKWTTPIVLSVFFLISAFLAALNVPLSAYNIVQEFTYRPNDTLPALALSGLVPSVFQPSANSFTPQLLTVGDIIKLNGSLLEYTVVDAFDSLDETKPVSSFSYYNNPLSEGCDVTNVTINVGLTREVEASFWYSQYETLAQVVITCRVPTLFHLVWSGIPPMDPAAGFSSFGNIAGILIDDLFSMFFHWYDVALISPPFSLNQTARTEHHNATMVNITVTAYACCHCDPAGSPEMTTLLEPPCSLVPPQFMVTAAYFTSENPQQFFSDYNAVNVSQTHPLMSTEALEKLAGQLGSVSMPDFTNAFQNVFQGIYHLVHLDLGVIIDNQIYNSPDMFNLSIMPVTIPDLRFPSNANESRLVTSNSTLVAQWRQRVVFFKNSDRVPVMDYLRPVPHLKPLGSAITSVFVSTFAMLSALWTIFSLGAGALARRTGQPPAEYIYFIASCKNLEAPAKQRLSMCTDSEDTICAKSGRFAFKRFGVDLDAKDSGWDMGTSTIFDSHREPNAPYHTRLKQVEDDVREIKCMMRLLLEKPDRLDHNLKANPNMKDGILLPLVHRRSSSDQA